MQKLGIDEFKRVVMEELKTVPSDPRHAEFRREAESYREEPSMPPTHLNGHAKPEGFDEWFATNVYKQKQQGYALATLTLPLGDLTSEQTRKLSLIADRFAGGNVRTTVEQNVVLRWVSENDLPALYTELKKIGLAQPGAGTIVDVAACPGTDTCKLGIASSRGLAAELRNRLGPSASLIRRLKTCASKSAVASIPAGNITWPIWDFMAIRGMSADTECHISR